MRYSNPKEIREAAQVEPPPGVRLWGVSPPQPLRRAVCGEMYHLIQLTPSPEESCASRSPRNPVEWPPQLSGLDEFAYAPAPTHI
jgi:hypothetical protein